MILSSVTSDIEKTLLMFIFELVYIYCTVLYCTILYCTVRYCTILYCTVRYCTIHSYLWWIHRYLLDVIICPSQSTRTHGISPVTLPILYCTVQYSPVLFSTVMYCTVKYSRMEVSIFLFKCLNAQLSLFVSANTCSINDVCKYERSARNIT